MFKQIQETIKTLNADVKTVANCEKAKKLRRQLLGIGLPMTIIGFLGLFISFILFATAGPDAFADDGGFTARLMVPFILMIPCMLIAAIGSKITTLGFSIVITGYTTNLINETVGDNCPKCGSTVNSEMLYCAKCGTKVKKECFNCKHINNYKNDFCEKCGNKLD